MAQQMEVLDQLFAKMPEGASPVLHSDYSEENAKPQNRRACIFLLDSAA